MDQLTGDAVRAKLSELGIPADDDDVAAILQIATATATTARELHDGDAR